MTVFSFGYKVFSTYNSTVFVIFVINHAQSKMLWRFNWEIQIFSHTERLILDRRLLLWVKIALYLHFHWNRSYSQVQWVIQFPVKTEIKVKSKTEIKSTSETWWTLKFHSLSLNPWDTDLCPYMLLASQKNGMQKLLMSLTVLWNI